jgi:hypothetical protein
VCFVIAVSTRRSNEMYQSPDAAGPLVDLGRPVKSGSRRAGHLGKNPAPQSNRKSGPQGPRRRRSLGELEELRD